MEYASASDDPKDITPVTPGEFAAGASGTQVTVSLADLWIMHDYARRMDAEDDPAVIRIGKAIEDAERGIGHENRPLQGD